jgi:integrase
VERRGRANHTLDYYVNKARHLVEFFGQADIHTISLASVEGYIDQRLAKGVKLATIAKEVGALASAIRHARKHGQYQGDAASVIPDELRGTYTPRDRHLSHDEFGALLHALNPDRRDYLVAYCGLGVREGELYRLRVADLNAGQSIVHIRGTKTSRSDRWIPLRPEVRDVLARRAADRHADDPLFPVWGNARRDLAAACHRAGIAPVSRNDLGRTFASWLAESGVPELVTASLLGHASSAMVRRVYARIGPTAQQQAIALLPPLTGTV